MENVVYILGAGFSAELGIPVVSNFLEEARDLFRLAPAQFKHFEPVFKRLTDLGHVKNFMKFDLDNVEEVLSLLQMEDEVTGTVSRKRFARFVADVVREKTPARPEFPPGTAAAGGDASEGVRLPPKWGPYLWLCASVAGVPLGYPDPRGAMHRGPAEPPKDGRYSIVTLNYDSVLETAFDALDALPLGPGARGVVPRPPIHKLHGCVTKGNIIAPTANKRIMQDVQESWESAFKCIRDATRIRVIGYSLPETDVYVRYLIGAAMSRAFNPKRIDVLCLDPSKRVRARYSAAFERRRHRFAGNVNASAYMSSIYSAGEAAHVSTASMGLMRPWWQPGSIEKAHESFFLNYTPEWDADA